MTLTNEGSRADDSSRNGTAGRAVRNPFGVMDVPDPNDADVQAFVATATLEARADDDNAGAWGTLGGSGQYDTIAGNWSSRWNGGADPTIPGDAADRWKQGLAEAPKGAIVSRARRRPLVHVELIGEDHDPTLPMN